MPAACPQHVIMGLPFSAEAVTKPIDPQNGLAPPLDAIAKLRLMPSCS